MKTPLLFFLLILNQTFAQWEIKINKNEKKISAIGEVMFSDHTLDSIVLNVSKSKLLGLDFALEGDYFKKSKKYYVLFEIDERKIKVLRDFKMVPPLLMILFTLRAFIVLVLSSIRP
jgi:hypothetical protein